MDVHALTGLALDGAGLIALVSLLRRVCERFAFPYTVCLVLAGSLGQVVTRLTGARLGIAMSPDFVYFYLLPFLLFESAFQINFHQFRLHFRTISFISTFGLLASLLVVGAGVAWLGGVPVGPAFLFGALISATDPIAVLAIFKTLGAPKRLALIADGESMFNDATGVIAFRAVSAIVLATGSGLGLHGSAGLLESFLYVFFGSIALGIGLGYLASKLVAGVHDDPLVEASVTVVLALGSFVSAEHFFRLSGVITTVMAAIVLGNFGQTRLSRGTDRFLEGLWGYVGFLSLSAVFFFASYQLDYGIVWENLRYLPAVIASVLLARAVSVYVSFAISNRLPFFKVEPNVPLSWQHVINWGGLRGIIPLVLAYSLPDSFAYKDVLVSYTLATFVFTLLVNALTIRALLVRLGLHLPRREEDLLHKEGEIYGLECRRERLAALSPEEFDPAEVVALEGALRDREDAAVAELVAQAGGTELARCLRLQGLAIERQAVRHLFDTGRINEAVFFEFDRELDLQEDELEHPGLAEARQGGSIRRFGRRTERFRSRLAGLGWTRRRSPLLAVCLSRLEERTVRDRCMLLKARVLANEEVLEYLERVRRRFEGSPEGLAAVDAARERAASIKKEGTELYERLRGEYPEVAGRYQRELLRALVG